MGGRLKDFGQTFLFGNFLGARYPPLEAGGDMGNDKHSTTSTPISSRPTKPTTSPKTKQPFSESQRCENSDKMGDATKSDRLVKQNLELLETGNLADAEIICNGRIWKVHQLILRSRCVWFEKAFANNWQEAQTGRIDLKEQQPERINELLKFIYSGRYTTNLASDSLDISSPILEVNVSLWQTADYFLLPSLKTEVEDYLLDWMAATLRLFHLFQVTSSIATSTSMKKRKLDAFLADLYNAVKTSYKYHTAREIHKLLAMLACGLRDWLSEPILSDLMRIPGFQKDMSTALIVIHFPQITKGAVAVSLEHSFTFAAKVDKCHACGKITWKKAKRSQAEFLELVPDPFSTGARKWCNGCAIPSIKSRLKTMMKEWPAESDRRGKM